MIACFSQKLPVLFHRITQPVECTGKREQIHPLVGAQNEPNV